MGEVWLADQKEPVRRRVAIKFVKAGMGSREVISRFESERQALALMNHPAIAKVFDAGTTPEGAPYFVMEYVAGVPITTYCDQHRLSTVERLKLFMEVCDGVQHAHRKAIIHRDLKPSNILVAEVDGRATPKIIDFGVAKALSQRLTADTIFTRIGAVVGTPEYMSPEQALSSGEDIDTRTDVYSLGIVFYELLAGTLPLEMRKIAYDEFLRRLREEDPPKPSTRIRTQNPETSTDLAHKRQTAPVSLVKQMRGDLDSIALKALEKDRSRRYSSASDFSADIGRYLRGEAVLAVPPSVSYRLRKYVRRHWIGLAAATVAACSLCAGAGVALYQARIAQQRFNDVRSLANKFLFDFEDKIHDLPGSMGARHMVVSTGLTYLDSLARQAGGDRSLQSELAHAYQRMGDVQGRDTSEEDLKGAAVSYQKSAAINEALAHSQPRNAAVRRELAATYSRLSVILRTQLDRHGAVDNAKLCTSHLEAAIRLEPRPDDYLPLGTCYANLGDAQLSLDDVAGAAVSLGHLLETREELAKRDHSPDVRRRLAVAHQRYANAVEETGDLETALQHRTEAQRLAEELLRENPVSTLFPGVLAKAYNELGSFQEEWREDFAGAAVWQRKAVELQHSVTVKDPADKYSLSQESVFLVDLARCLYNTDAAQSLATIEKSMAIAEPLRLGDPQSKRERLRYSIGLAGIAQAASRLGQKDKALRSIHEAVAMQVQDHQADLADFRERRGLADYYRDQAEIEFRLGERAPALASYAEAIRLMEGGGTLPPSLDAYEDVGDLYRSAAQAYGAIAKDPKTPADSRAGFGKQSVDTWRKSLDVWNRWKTAGKDNDFVRKRVEEATHALVSQ